MIRTPPCSVGKHLMPKLEQDAEKDDTADKV